MLLPHPTTLRGARFKTNDFYMSKYNLLMMKPKLYIIFKSFGKDSNALDLLKEKCDVIINKTEKRPNKEELKKLAKEYDGLIIGVREVIDEEVLENSKLKFIGVLAGKENIDLEECKKRNIAVFDIVGSNAISVAEHTFALILGSAKNILNMDKSVRCEEFDKVRNSGIDLDGKILGVVGAGYVAREVIKRAKNFGMNILCWTFHPEKHKDLGVKFVKLDELLKNSDFISLHIRASEKTKELIGKRELNLMKPIAFLINTSRGEIVDEDALVEALKNKQIAGAGLDVFKEEPTYNKKLFKLDNVILTPHAAGISKDAIIRMEEKLAKDIVEFLK
jgi:phosphoglycerate dehydrogenase-like enzyme